MKTRKKKGVGNKESKRKGEKVKFCCETNTRYIVGKIYDLAKLVSLFLFYFIFFYLQEDKT